MSGGLRGGVLALARTAVPRAAEYRNDQAWLAAAWADPDTAVLRVDDGLTVVRHDSIVYVSPGQVADEAERYFLGLDGGRAYFAVKTPLAGSIDTELETADGPGSRAAGLREIGSALNDRDAGLFVLAVALSNWHETHRHCPRCGAQTLIAAGGFIRRCPVDGSEHYPRTDPAIIVLVTDRAGERCLLGRGVSWGPGRFSTLAGFVEPGESAEAATAREVHEETGVRISDVTYLGSQPWPFPSSLMLGFIARATDQEAEPVADGVEMAEARWFSRPALAAALTDGAIRLPPPVSIARRLIEHWYGTELEQPDVVTP
jgi:NAD+ diphosphatase